ncbi:retrotransposon protein, putative, ty1-copia subclass [Tanacetum coccineum]
MEQPEGFIDPNHPSKVCKLQRSIYGLKQASRSWNKRFDEEIKKFGFHQNLDEPCVYQKASGSNVIFLILYVDDIILMGNHIPSLQEVKDYLGDKTCDDGVVAQNISSRFSQILVKLTSLDMKIFSLKYLRNTKDMFLVYGCNPVAELQVKCYCDARFETDRDDTKSQTGYVFVFEWVWEQLYGTSYTNKVLLAQHATEDEFIAAFLKQAKSDIWIRKFIDELGILPLNDYPIKMNCDNSATIIIAKESGIQKGAGHFKKYH